MSTCGGVGSNTTVRRVVPVRPTASEAVTLITLLPGRRPTEKFHVSVPVAVPPGPRSDVHVTLATPTSSVAIPPITIGVTPVDRLIPVVGAVMVTTGAAGS